MTIAAVSPAPLQPCCTGKSNGLATPVASVPSELVSGPLSGAAPLHPEPGVDVGCASALRSVGRRSCRRLGGAASVVPSELPSVSPSALPSVWPSASGRGRRRAYPRYVIDVLIGVCLAVAVTVYTEIDVIGLSGVSC